MTHPAAFATKLDGDRVRCGLCPKACTIGPGEVGKCFTRKNVDGALVSLIYGRLLASAVDPIEKKPLFHYRPGSRSLSVAAAGCNLVCPFCQNYSLSQTLRCAGNADVGGRPTSPEEVIAAALESHSKSISFTYSEPVLMFEFARDVAKLAAPHDLGIVYVSNGQITKGACRELAGFCNAANIDLKSFSERAYNETLGGHLGSTLNAIETLHGSGAWVEVTTLVIPGFNDSDEELAQIARFIANLGREIPWHVSRFHPDFNWNDHRPTPVATLRRARQIGSDAGLDYVYTGNLPGDDGENTFCPKCQTLLIDRRGFSVSGTNLNKGQCPKCSHGIAGRGLNS